MPTSTVAASTPNYVLIDGNLRIGPKILPLDFGTECWAIYGFSSKSTYDRFCSNSQRALKPYPLVPGYLRNQMDAPGDRLKLVVMDASAQRTLRLRGNDGGGVRSSSESRRACDRSVPIVA